MEVEVIKDVLYKLIGPILPVGETNIDSKRFKNLDTHIEVTESLLYELKEVYKRQGHQHSIKKAQTRAQRYLQEVVDELACDEVVTSGS